MRFRYFSLVFSLFLVSVIPAKASTGDTVEAFSLQTRTLPGALPFEGAAGESRADRMWRVNFDTPNLVLDAPAADSLTVADEQRTQAVQYSDAYNTRRKIHVIASFATLPLFVGQYNTGEKLYEGTASDTVKTLHGVLAGSIAGLFAVNTVTGVWSLKEARHDPNGKTRRLVHGILMLGADAGFVATGLMAPGDHEDVDNNDKAAHRNVALASMGMATASYLYMLFTR
jgi:hypothetical protein